MNGITKAPDLEIRSEDLKWITERMNKEHSFWGQVVNMGDVIIKEKLFNGNRTVYWAEYSTGYGGQYFSVHTDPAEASFESAEL